MLRTDATVSLRCNRTMQTDMKRPAKSPAKTNTVELDQPCEIAGSVVRNCRARGEHSVEPGVRLALVLHREVPPTTRDASEALLTTLCQHRNCACSSFLEAHPRDRSDGTLGARCCHGLWNV